jgi:hypothetical protein
VKVIACFFFGFVIGVLIASTKEDAPAATDAPSVRMNLVGSNGETLLRT